MRAALLVLSVLLVACGGDDDGDTAERRPGVSTPVENEDLTAETPTGEVAAGRAVCEEIKGRADDASTESFVALREDAPPDLRDAIDAVADSVNGDDADEVFAQLDRLADVCSQYGVELERVGGG